MRIIRGSGLPNRMTSVFTETEGEWDEVMKADIRPGYANMMTAKIKKMESIPGGKNE